MHSRGGETGGLTIMEALGELEGRGYTTQFAAREGGTFKCFECDKRTRADQMRLASLRRIEGVSDPADMAAVVALECPQCGAKGSAVLKYGPESSAEDGEALRLVEDARKRLGQSPSGEWTAPPSERRFEEPELDMNGPRYRDIHPGLNPEADEGEQGSAR